MYASLYGLHTKNFERDFGEELNKSTQLTDQSLLSTHTHNTTRRRKSPTYCIHIISNSNTLFNVIFPKNIKGGGSIKTFYHGTSDVININKVILPPNQTDNLREDWRKKNLDKVYFTSSQLSAEMYAKKACKKYGGNPVVYIVKPIGQWFHRVDTEYIADKALVLGTL